MSGLWREINYTSTKTFFQKSERETIVLSSRKTRYTPLGKSQLQYWPGAPRLILKQNPNLQTQKDTSQLRGFFGGLLGLQWDLFSILGGGSVSQFSQSCPTLCNAMNRSTPGLPVHHKLPEFTQTHAHWVGDAIQPSHPLSSPYPPAPNPSQNQGLFQWVNSLHEVAKVLEFQLQHQSFQWTPRTDFL